MSGFDDDALRDMLTSRADRLTPNAPGEVMVRVRAEVRGPRQGAAFSVLPVLTGRSPAMGAGWAAAIMVAVLVMVILGTRPATVATPSSAGAGTTVVSPSVSPSASSATTPSLPTTMALADLRRAVTDRSLDGRLVLVDTTLLASYTSCATDPCSPQYQLQFVGPVTTDARPGQPVVPGRPADGTPPLVGTFVIVPWQGTLILVGRLEGSLGSPVSWTTITTGYVPPDPGSEIAIQAVTGWLIRNVAVPCPSVASGDAGCGPVDQLADGPVGNGGPATIPRVDVPALGIDASANPVAGPFLVRTGTGVGLEIVGRYDLGAYTAVATPTVTCDIPTATTMPPCDKLVTLAIEGLPAGGVVMAVEVHQGAWDCPSSGLCASVPPDQRAFVIVRTTAGDWEVGLSFDAHGIGVDAVPMPLASSYPVPSSAAVTCGLDPGTKLPSCNEVVAEALRALQSTGTIQSIEVGQGSYCPPGTACPTVEVDRVHVIVHAAFGDWVVALAYGPDGKLVTVTASPLPSADASPDPSVFAISSSGTPWATCLLVVNAPASDINCDAAIAAALSVMPSGTTVVSAEFVPGTTECPPWEKCLGVPYDPKSGHVTVKAKSGAYLWVPVKLGSDSIVVASSAIPAPSGWPTTSLMP